MTTRPKLFWRIAVALLAALALASCGGDDDSSSNGGDSNGAANGGDSGASSDQSFTLATKEFEFTPDAVTINAGSAEVVVDNSGGVVEHDFTIDELDIEVYAAPGQTESASFEFEAGTYEFYCSIPGHREAGMEGTLTVS